MKLRLTKPQKFRALMADLRKYEQCRLEMQDLMDDIDGLIDVVRTKIAKLGPEYVIDADEQIYDKKE